MKLSCLFGHNYQFYTEVCASDDEFRCTACKEEDKKRVLSNDEISVLSFGIGGGIVVLSIVAAFYTAKARFLIGIPVGTIGGLVLLGILDIYADIKRTVYVDRRKKYKEEKVCSNKKKSLTKKNL